jgi:hypothetical protein
VLGDGGAQKFIYHSTGRPTADNVSTWDGAGADDYFIVTNLDTVNTLQCGIRAANTAAANQVLLDAAVAAFDEIILSAFTHNVNYLQVDSNTTVRGVDRALSVIKKDVDGGVVPVSAEASVVMSKDWDTAPITNVTLENFTVDGSRDELDFTGNLPDGNAMGIAPFGIQGLTMNDIIVKDCHTDGVYVSATHSSAGTQGNTLNLFSTGLTIENSGRQGITINSGENLTFTDTVIDGVNRTSPRAAIDIEPNGNQVFPPRNIKFSGLQIVNAKQGIVASDASAGILSNGDFATDTVWTKGTGWTIGSGVATHGTGSASALSQSYIFRGEHVITFTVSGRTAGSVEARLSDDSDGTGNVVSGTSRVTNATFTDSLLAADTSGYIAFFASSDFDGSIDDVSVKQAFALCEVQVNNMSIQGDGTETLTCIHVQDNVIVTADGVTAVGWGQSSGQVLFNDDDTARLIVSGFYARNCTAIAKCSSGYFSLSNSIVDDANTTVLVVDGTGELYIDGLTVDGAGKDTGSNVLNCSAGKLFATDMTLNDVDGLGIRVESTAEAHFTNLVMTEVDSTTLNLRDTATVTFDGVRLHNIETDDTSAKPITITSPNVHIKGMRITGNNLTGTLFDFTDSGTRCDNAEIEITHGGIASQGELDAAKVVGHGNSWQTEVRATTGASQIHYDGFVRVDSGTIALDEHANWDGNVITIANASGGQLTVTVVAGPATITGVATIEDDDVAVFQSDGTTFFRVLSTDGIGVSKVGTPVDNEVGIWTGDGTIEGDANFTWTGSQLGISTSDANTSISGGTGMFELSNTNGTDGNYVQMFFNDQAAGAAAGVMACKITDHSNNYGDFQFWTRGVGGSGIRLHIDQEGDVGIGNTAPAEQLDVTGSVRANEFFVTGTEVGITASVTQTQGQQPLTFGMNQVATVANANDVVTLPEAAAGRACTVVNSGANTLQIFPASGDDLGAGLNTSTTLATASIVRFEAWNAVNWLPI